ncbi:hypothetical protein [Microbacterium sp. RU33B]|uniref:hypothetical protein n=1 Tax=Microbacterium sp. RU33B TaxID=1907390 RepID=UPI0011804987|nr:hypothetical protein [Microbacterium sp. RU33B]
MNITPIPVFFTINECEASGVELDDLALLEVAGHTIVPVTELAGTSDLTLIAEGISIEPIALVNRDGLHTEAGVLVWEYSILQLELILDIAEARGIRAFDAATYLARCVFPKLGVLDSAKNPVTRLDSLPRHTSGLSQRACHGESNFPLTVVPPGMVSEGRPAECHLQHRPVAHGKTDSASRCPRPNAVRGHLQAQRGETRLRISASSRPSRVICSSRPDEGRRPHMPHDWHPFLDAVEAQPGIWTLTAQYADQPYARIDIRRTPMGVRYRMEACGQVIGFATTLRVAREQAHRARLASLGPGGRPMADWGGSSWRRDP